MINLFVEVEDIDNNFEVKELELPCNLKECLTQGRDYLIANCEPHITGVTHMDIWELNTVLDEINCGNPGMTAEYLAILAEAADVIDLSEETFIYKVIANDFVFVEIDGYINNGKASDEEKAARYIIENFGIPFDTGITKKHISILTDPFLRDYIAWEYVWDQYQLIGFKLVDGPDFNSLYLVHWV